MKSVKEDVDNLSQCSGHSNQSGEPAIDKQSNEETTKGKQEVHTGPLDNIPTGLSNLDHNSNDGAPSSQWEDGEVKRGQPDTSEGGDVSGQASDEIAGDDGKLQVSLSLCDAVSSGDDSHTVLVDFIITINFVGYMYIILYYSICRSCNGMHVQCMFAW